jgi:hypothetical protein
MPVNEKDIAIPTAIADITAIDLTLAGEIELMQFHHEAVNFANKRMLKTPPKDAPFTYFIKLCQIWHQENNAPVNPQLVESIQKQYGIQKSELKINSNGRSPNYVEDKTPQKGMNGEFTRKPIERVHVNTHTDEEYETIKKYHQKMRPHEYVITFDGKLNRTPARESLEEELALPSERRKIIVEKLQERWESSEVQNFRHFVTDSTAMNIYARLVMQLETGRMWPDDDIPEK